MGYLLDDAGDVLLDENSEPLWDEFGPDSDPGDPGDPGGGLVIAAPRFPWVRLEAPGVEPLTFAPADGWYVDDLNLGSVDIRDTSQPAPDWHGTIDPTSLIGARDVILRGTMIPDVAELWEMREALAAFNSPRIRSTITFQESADAPIRMLRRCRAVQIPTRVVDANADSWRAVFRVERGIIESAALNVRDVYASGPGLTAGRVYPLEFPRTYPIAPPVGSTPIVNAGKFDAAPIIRVFGPVTGITIENRTVGRALVFNPGFSVAAGDYLEIDVAGRTIRLNSDPTASRQSELDFAESRRWWLTPGVNDIRFTPLTYTTGARAEITWRDTWLG